MMCIDRLATGDYGGAPESASEWSAVFVKRNHVSEFRYSIATHPLVVITCPARFEVDQIKTVLANYQREVLEARKTFVLVVDATHVVELPNALARRAITEWIVPVEDLGARYMLGMAMATPNVLVRGAMTAITWIAPAKVPMVYPPTMRDAVQWGLAQLEAARIPLTPELVRYAASFDVRPRA
jgi:hypothetical protein